MQGTSTFFSHLSTFLMYGMLSLASLVVILMDLLFPLYDILTLADSMPLYCGA